MNIPITPFVYRGKSLEEYNKGQWITGCLRYKYLMGDAVPLIGYCRGKVVECDYIDPDTLGVSWGMKDKNGREVFTGMKVKNEFGTIHTVVFHNDKFQIERNGLYCDFASEYEEIIEEDR
jgi:hypothetical protein